MTRLPESPSRWLEFPLWLLLTTLLLAPLPGFVRALLDGSLAANAGLLEVLAAALGGFVLFVVGRRFVRCLRAGRSWIEVSHPATVGARLDYLIRLGREGTATLLCRQRQHRRATIDLVSIPLGPAVFDPQAQRWRIQGSTTIPLAPASDRTRVPNIDWEIDVRMTFASGGVLLETHPLRVAGRTTPAAPLLR